MKKVILVLMAVWAALAAQAYDYKPLVEPGKTWWYKATNSWSSPLALGLRMDGTETIDGVEWTCCRLVDPTDRGKVLEPVVARVREEGTTMYLLPCEWTQEVKGDYGQILTDVYFEWLAHILKNDYIGKEIRIMDFAFDAGASVDIKGDEIVTVEKTGTETSAGIERRVLECSNPFSSGPYVYIDGIGAESPGLFFFPCNNRTTGYLGDWFVHLQGVVDAQEGLLWVADESITAPWDVAGIADAVADGAVRERVSVYTPWGMCVRRDVQREESLSGLPSGVYIVTDGAETRKVAVR